MILNKELLAQSLRHLLRTTPRKPTLPILSCVKIASVEGAILLTTTDLDRETTISIPAPKPIGLAAKLAAKRAVPLVVPASVLANCAKSADAGSDIHITDKSVTFQIAGSWSAVPVEGYPAEEWPDSPTSVSTPVGVRIATDRIKRLLRCVSTDEFRFAICGIHWSPSGDLVATDGLRLHLENSGAACPVERGIIIPTAACKLIPENASISLISSSEEPPRFVIFTIQEKILTIRILSKLVEGNYPNYRQVIPEPSGKTLRFNNEQAAAALRKLAAMAKRTSVRLTPADHAITFSVKEYYDGTPCGSFTQPAVITGALESITFDTGYLITALENGGDCIDYADGLSPGLITGIGNRTHVLMAIRTSDTTPKPSTPKPSTPEPDDEPCEEEEEPCEA
jgi:DNA polymerase-3 subunit beta